MKTATLSPIRVAPGYQLWLEGLLERGDSWTQFVENAVRVMVANRKNLAEFIRHGTAAIEATKPRRWWYPSRYGDYQTGNQASSGRAGLGVALRMTHQILFSEAAAVDSEPQFEVAQPPALNREMGDVAISVRVVQAIQGDIALLACSPFACQKAGIISFFLELMIPFGHAGYVALFGMVDSVAVTVGAIGHQCEEAY